MKDQQKLYNWFWSWHTFAGLILAPILICSALTGAVYSFNKEISDWLYSDLRFSQSEPGASRPGIYQQYQKAQERLGKNTITGIVVNQEEARNHRFIAELAGSHEGEHERHLMVYTDSRTGEVVGEMYEDDDFMEIVLAIHRELLSGKPGRIMVELCASWGLFLLISGLYIWWPRGRQSFKQVLRVHSPAKPKTFFRSLHSVVGVYSLFFFGLFIVTGMFFTPIWGEGYKIASRKAYPEMGLAFRPAKIDKNGYENQPMLGRIDQIVTMLRERARPGEEISLMLPRDDKTAIKAYTRINDDQFTYNSFDINPYTAEIVAATSFNNVPLPVQIQRVAVSLHRGKILGLGTQIFAMLACLAIGFMIIAGISLWWLRRPESWSRLLSGPAPIPKELPKSIIVVMLLGMLFFPAFGISALVVITLQQCMRLTFGAQNEAKPK